MSDIKTNSYVASNSSSTPLTFMDYEPDQDWTAYLPKVKTTQDAATAQTFDLNSTLTDLYNFDGTNENGVGSQSYFDNLLKNNGDNGFGFGDYFNAENLGGTLSGIGKIGGAIASIYGMIEQKKFNDDILDMEKARVAKENELRDKQQSEYDAVWKA